MGPALAILLAAATPHGCADLAKERGTRVFERTPQALVFGRPDRRVIRGCTRHAHRAFPLRDLCCGTSFKLNGRFIGYAYEGSAIGDETSKVGGIDLKTGRLIHYPKISPNSEGGGNEIETGGLVTRYFVSPTGSLVWLKQVPGDGFVLSAADRAERVVDEGNITKVDLRANRIEYVKDGAALTALLRR